MIGTAGSGFEAIEKIEKLKPDVVTLDVEMPGMNGIETLRHIMSANPLPVIMLSTLTRDHADITMEALSIGACDFVTKDFSNFTLADKEQELIGKVKDVAKNRAKLRLKGFLSPHPARPLSIAPGASAKRSILSIGASTGGPPVLQYILSHLPKDFPVPIVIAQHMPRLFTQSFAERLDKISQLAVKEAEDKEVLTPGVALIAPGDTHLALRRKGRQVTVEMVNSDAYIYRPSVDLLMEHHGSGVRVGRRRPDPDGHGKRRAGRSQGAEIEGGLRDCPGRRDVRGLRYAQGSHKCRFGGRGAPHRADTRGDYQDTVEGKRPMRKARKSKSYRKGPQRDSSLQLGQSDDFTRARIIEKLVSSPSRELVEHVVRLLDDKNTSLRMDVLDILRKTGNYGIDAVIHLLYHPNEDIRVYGCEVLREPEAHVVAASPHRESL